MTSPFFKYVFLIGLSVGSWMNTHAQDLVFKSDIYSEHNRSEYSDVFPFYNNKTEETAIFLEDDLGDGFDLILLDDTEKQRKIIRGRTPKLRVPEFVGTMYDNNVYTSYFIDHGNFMLGTTSFNTETGITDSETMYLQLKRGEKVVTQFEYNNLFYFVVLKKETSDISFHTYKNNTFLEKKTIELNNEDFPHFLRDNLYNCVAYNKGKFKSVDLLNPLFADQNSDYFTQQDGSFYMVVNTHKVVKIDLATMQHRIIDFPINYAEANEAYKKGVLKNIIKNTKSKSTIYNNIFFRVSVVKQTIRLQAYDIESGKEYFNEVIDNNHLDALTIYDTPFRRDVNTQTKEELLFRALHTGAFGFRVFKDGENYKIHLGKVATNDFWDIFDNNSNKEASARNERLGFTTKFVGIFSDYKGEEPNSYLLSPVFDKEDIQSRYLEFTVNTTSGILPVKPIEKDYASNRFTVFTDKMTEPVYDSKLNGLFRKDNQLHYISYNPFSKQLFVYKL